MTTDPTATPEYQARKRAEFDALGVPEDTPEWRDRVRTARMTTLRYLDASHDAIPPEVQQAIAVLTSDALHRRPVPLWVDEEPLGAQGRGWWPPAGEPNRA